MSNDPRCAGPAPLDPATDLAVARQHEEDVRQQERTESDWRRQAQRTYLALEKLAAATATGDALTAAERIAAGVEEVVQVAEDVIRAEWQMIDWPETERVVAHCERFGKSLSGDARIRLFNAAVNFIGQTLHQTAVNRTQLAGYLPTGYFKTLPRVIIDVLRMLLWTLIRPEFNSLHRVPS